MRRVVPLAALLAGCAPGELSVDALDRGPGEGWATDPLETWSGHTPTEPTDPRWNGATLTVLSPAAGDLLIWGATHTFEAEVVAQDGTPLSLDDAAIEWGSDLAPNWYQTGASFETDGLPIGIHDFTAWAHLPNGAVLQHTVGGVKVQHAFGGTYAGVLDVDGSVQQIPISCIGAGLVVIDRFGEHGTGEGDCLVNLLAVDVPLHLLYDLDIATDGAVTGTVGVDLAGWFTYNFDAEGALDPSATLDLSFSGDVPLMGPLSGTTTAERISLDSQ